MNGGRPVSSSYSRQPVEYRSLRASTRSPRACSGRQVLRGADHLGGLGHRGLGVADRPGDAEVHHLDLGRPGQHHVAGLDVPVHDAVAVAVVQRPQHPVGDLQRPLREQPPVVAEQFAQGPAVHVLHHDVRHVGRAGHRPRRCRTPRRWTGGSARRRTGPRGGTGPGTSGPGPGPRGGSSPRRSGPAGCPGPGTPRPCRPGRRRRRVRSGRPGAAAVSCLARQ